jgi:hypothetical protein
MAAMATAAAAAPPITHWGRPVIMGTPPVLTFVLLELLDAFGVEDLAELPAVVGLLDAALLKPVELLPDPVSPAAELVAGVADVEGIVPVAPDAAGNGPSVMVTA